KVWYDGGLGHAAQPTTASRRASTTDATSTLRRVGRIAARSAPGSRGRGGRRTGMRTTVVPVALHSGRTGLRRPCVLSPRSAALAGAGGVLEVVGLTGTHRSHPGVGGVEVEDDAED